MRTVKELAKLTGISARTLHYYDEIGLLSPTARSEAGYRLYDDKALEALRQILFFREFGIPLKEIRSVMRNPALDRNQILQTQRKMLEAKKNHIERLISSIDDILKGADRMDFGVFSRAEVEGIFNSMLEHVKEEQMDALTKQYGGVDGFREHFMENASDEKTQRNWAKVVEWYGDKDSALDAAKNPVGEEVTRAYSLRSEAVIRKLAERMNEGYAADSFEVKEAVGEYGFIQRQLFRIKNEKAMMLQMAELYQDREEVHREFDKQYGKGTALFFAEAIKCFYGDSRSIE